MARIVRWIHCLDAEFAQLSCRSLMPFLVAELPHGYLLPEFLALNVTVT